MADVTQDETWADLGPREIINRIVMLALCRAPELERAKEIAVARMIRPAPQPSDVAVVRQFMLSCCRIASESPVTQQATDEYVARRAALFSLLAASRVPEGWQLVPKVPTPEMIEEGASCVQFDYENGSPDDKPRDASECYAAMLAVAPAPEEKK